jgi:hypothetical protein
VAAENQQLLPGGGVEDADGAVLGAGGQASIRWLTDPELPDDPTANCVVASADGAFLA